MEKEKENFQKKKENMVNDSFMELFINFFFIFLNRSFVAEKLFPIANSKHYKVFSFLVGSC